MQSEVLAALHREMVYLWFYITVLLEQIAPYWALGIVLGSAISVFGKEKIHQLFTAMQGRRLGAAGVILASILGIASPLCMYGTIPIAASFSKKGMPDDWLAAFMMSSILLNPQLILYSAALGPKALWIRILSCFLCGIAAGILIRIFCRAKPFFDFSGFSGPGNRDTDPNALLRLIKNIGRNIKATGLWFFLGIVLSAAFERYVPAGAFAGLFGKNEGFGVLMAATIGVPVYVCGGGTIPLLMEWLSSGMSLGAAASFMITGPATKITNLGALKIVLGMRRFLIYLLFVMASALFTGLLVDSVGLAA